jgi:transmembrane sensor
MLTDADWARLARYVLGEYAPADRAREQAWIEADAERRAIAAELRALRAASPPPIPEWNEERAWARLQRSVGLGGEAAVRPLRVPAIGAMTSRRPRGVVWVGRIAATVVAAAIGATILWVGRGRTPAHVAMRELATARGQRVTLVLGDGTKITLGPATILRYPADLWGEDRTVDLEGQAYFEVRHDAAHPLVVHTPRAVTEDIGTTFVVRDYAADIAPRVTVADGQVSVHAPRRPGALVSGGQTGTIASAGTVTVAPAPDLAADMAWAQGELVFRQALLRDVLPELSRWYDVDLTLTDSTLGDLRVTTTFKDEPLAGALDALVAALRLRYERHGRAIVLHPRVASTSESVHVP